MYVTLGPCNRAETNNFCPGRHSSIVVSLQATKTFRWEIGRDILGRCCLCFCDLLSEINNFSLHAVLPSRLVSQLLKHTPPELKPRTYLRSYGLCKISSWSHWNKHATFDANSSIRSGAICMHTYTCKNSILYVTYRTENSNSSVLS
jgi:hypothetical protein